MDVNEYYRKLTSPAREICLKLREIITSHYPNIVESMLWGVPVFENGLYYIVALKDHMNLGFTVSNLTKEEDALFQGGGKTTRKIEIRTLNDIDTSKITKLLEIVKNKKL